MTNIKDKCLDIVNQDRELSVVTSINFEVKKFGDDLYAWFEDEQEWMLCPKGWTYKNDLIKVKYYEQF